jgi:CheY-like chemotaxis protein
MNKGPPLEARAPVLVVDDEPLVRILTVQVLEEAGFPVEEAGNSEEALSRAWMATKSQPWSLTLTCPVLSMGVSLHGVCARSVQPPLYSLFPEWQRRALTSYPRTLDF